MARFLITGCSGGGKTTLLRALSAKGHATVSEPGERLIAKGIAPWDDAVRFLEAALEMAADDLERHERTDGAVFFDRGTIDAAAGLERAGLGKAKDFLAPLPKYDNPVFLAPPWPEIFTQTATRQYGFTAAIKEFQHLETVVPALGYETVHIPKIDIFSRVDFVVEVAARRLEKSLTDRGTPRPNSG